MKKIFYIVGSLLLSLTIISCANTNVTPNIQSVSLNSTGTEITLVLEGVNQATENQVAPKLKLRRGSLQNNDVSFSIVATGTSSFSDSNSYTLSSFDPALVSGQAYYLIAASGAFNNTGGLTESGQSDEGIYQLFVP